MSYFNDFLEEELEMIISLPARVGGWMARQDDVKLTRKDEAKELKALHVLLTYMTKAKKSPFVADIAEQTLTYQHRWETWVKGGEDVLFKDIAKARRMLDERLPEDVSRSYRGMLWRVGKTVALAYGEAEGTGDDLISENLITQLFVSLMEKIGGDMPNDPVNISTKEREGLKKLRTALQN